MDISKTEVNFYIITPQEYEDLIREKCSSTWPKATIEKIESIKIFSDNALKYQLSYRKSDALSLKVDRKCNEPLNSILNVLDIMDKDSDRVGIYYNFVPADQLSWKNKHINIIEDIKVGKQFNKERYSAVYFTKLAIDKVVNSLIAVYKRLSEFIGGEGPSLLDEIAVSKVGINAFDKLHDATLRKGDRNILNSQIIVLSDSPDKIRRKNNAIAVAESFKTIAEDNSFNYKPIKSKVYYTEYKVKGAEVNKVSTEEVTNFIQLPGRSLLLQHENIEKVDVLESPVPEELQSGTMCIGEVTYM